MPEVGYRKRRPKWTEEDVLEKVQEWHRLYGRPPIANDWNGSELRASARRNTLVAQNFVERYRRFSSGEWPWKKTVLDLFGSWDDVIAAAGLTPDPAQKGPLREYPDGDTGTLLRIIRQVEEADRGPARNERLLELANTAIAMALEK